MTKGHTVDPNEALRIIRETRADLFSEGEPYDPETVRTLAEAVDGLDSWLSSGGFKPLAWENFGGLKTPEVQA